MHEQSNNGFPKAKLHVENVQREQAEKQYEQDTRDARRPEQDLFEGFIHGVLQCHHSTPTFKIKFEKQ